MSNYPPGVTGFEPQIAGPGREWDEEREVEHECDEERFEEGFTGSVTGTVTQWDYFTRTFWFECPQCGVEVDKDDEPEEPDYERDDD